MSDEIDLKYNLADESTPLNVQLNAHYKKSYAFYTISHRVPVIVTNLIDSLTREKEDLINKFGQNVKEELKECIGLLSKLKYELQTGKVMSDLSGDDSDQMSWNSLLKSLGTDNTYFSAPWLYAECYVYRRIKSIFTTSPILKDFDYFSYHKKHELDNSIGIILNIITSINEFNNSNPTSDQLSDYFCKILKVNLWGNKNDLSISLGQEISDGQSRDPIKEVENFNEFLLIDQTKEIWNCLKQKDNNVVDFINDNAGYEILCDFILSDFMLHHGIAKTIRFRVKSIPWFISDALPSDFHETIEKLMSHKSEFISEFGTRLHGYVESGKLQLINPPSLFFTGPYEFRHMKDKDLKLYESIAESDLAIFKGDLNYRKLLADINWDPTVSFEESLCGFKPTNLCSLRTVKADLISGLTQAQVDKLTSEDQGETYLQWMTSGQYGVIHFLKK